MATNIKPILIDTKIDKDIIDIDDTLVNVDEVNTDDHILEEETYLTGKEVVTTTYTYKTLLEQKHINDDKDFIINKEELDSKLKSFKEEQDSIKKDINIKEGNYNYDITYKEILKPNPDIIIDKEDDIKAFINDSNTFINNKDKIINIKTNSVIDYVSATKKGIIDYKEDLINIKKQYKDAQTISLKQHRNPKLDTSEITTYESNKISETNKDDDNIQIKISYEPFFIEEDNNPITKTYKTEQECHNYMDILTKTGYKINDYTIMPIYIKRIIEEEYDNEELALNRKTEILNDYPSSTVTITKKRDIKKDIAINVISEEEYSIYEEALNSIVKSANIIPRVTTIQRQEMVTIDNEPYTSEAEALKRVDEVSKLAINGTPLQYALKKIDDYFYGLTMVYYGVNCYYSPNYTELKTGYNYLLEALIPVIDSYNLDVKTATKKTKYKVTKETITKGYSYDYEISYQKKKSHNIYIISTATPKYKLNVKAQGTYDIYKTFKVTKKTEKPLYKYKTKVLPLIKQTNNDKTYILEKK